MAPVRVLGSATNSTSVALVRRWQELGLDAMLVSALDLAPVTADTTVVGRLDVLPTLDGVEPGLTVLLALEWQGVRVLNRAFALASAHDKLLTARKLERAGIPHPRSAALGAEGRLPIGLPLVIKPRLGSWGRDVFRCRDEAELEATLEVVRRRPWFRRHGALVQELVPSPGYDLRIVVAGGEVVAAGERVAAPGEWRTNIALGGRRRRTDPPTAARSLAVAAASAIGADLVGVDLMPQDGSYVVLELNGAVEFDEHYELGGREVYAEAARALGLLG